MEDESIIDLIKQTYKGKESALVLRAHDFAKIAHKNQKRASGEPYFTHPCAVAKILIDLGMDSNTICAAFLHDVLEDTPVSERELEEEFGDEVLLLVQGVTKLEKIEFKSREERDAENFRKILVSMSKDIRVIILKLADRLHNMRSLNFLSQDRQQRMARETLDIFSPLAGRLGISQIKCELDDLCLKYLEPESFQFLVQNIHQKLNERHEFVDKVVSEIKVILQESKIKGDVFGRPKHFYSIYKKMRDQKKTLDQIYDLAAVRVIVNSVEECYEVFGKIHKKWTPMPGRIKDYIAAPKANGYQSLHTTVVTEFGQPFEIQIRTAEMHKMAEYGVAAHWKYKEKISKDKVNDIFNDKLTWVNKMIEAEGGLKDSKEFIDSFKTDLYTDELLVFTPTGQVISLPMGATPIDYAYAIHSEVGNKCVGAKVNGKMVQITSKLETGNIVEIITSPNSKGPSWDWLKYVKSSSARAKIKQFFRREMKDDNIKLGKKMLEEEAKHRGYVLSDILSEDSFKKVSDKLSFTTYEEMFASIGFGAVSVNQVIFKLIDFYKRETPKPKVVQEGSNKNTNGVVIKGMSGLLVRFAGCCTPVPGDDIVGFVSRGRGIVVHRADCPNMAGMETDRLCSAEWSKTGEARFVAMITIKAKDQVKALTQITAIISELKIVLSSVNSRLDKNKNAIIELSVKVNERKDIDQLIYRIGLQDSVLDVFRTTV